MQAIEAASQPFLHHGRFGRPSLSSTLTFFVCASDGNKTHLINQFVRVKGCYLQRKTI